MTSNIVQPGGRDENVTAVDDENVCHAKFSTRSLREHDHHRSSVPCNDDTAVTSGLVRRRPLSKSDFDLSYPEDLDYLCKKFAAAERRHVTMESFASSSSPSTPGAGQGCCPSAINSSSCATATAQSTIQSINVVQKTHSFFNSLKEKWAKGRNKARGSDTDESPSESPILTRLVRPDTLQQTKTSDSKNTQNSITSEFGLTQNWFQKVVSRDHQIRLRRQNSIRSEQQIDLATPEGQNPIQNDALLRKYDFFQLKIHLKKGKDLIARDKNGLSDPYVKFKAGGRQIHKSKIVYKSLNPTWDETFTHLLDDPFEPIQIKVFDYDWGLQDDFMGAAQIALTTLELDKQHEICLQLRDTQNVEYLGEIYLDITLTPQSREEREQSLQKIAKVTEIGRKYKCQVWSSVVTIVLIKIKNCTIAEGLCDPYVRFRLGGEKFKSKGSNRMPTPTWLEQFDLHLFDDQTQELEINVCAKERSREEIVASTLVDLSKLEREKTHKIKYKLNVGGGDDSAGGGGGDHHRHGDANSAGGGGILYLLLTISGTSTIAMVSDLSNYEREITEQEHVRQKYAAGRTFCDLLDVGVLTVRVYRALGLTSADLCGKSDPFCVLELVNARLQTHTEYKTLTPTWDKIFTFNVKDINSVLEVTVFDEDPDYKVEFLGKVAVPLLSINNGVQKWYSLKDKKLLGRAKGNNPKILLEMRLIWNPIRAFIRTLNPKEEKYMQQEIKFKRQTLIRNVMRLKQLVLWAIDIGKYFEYWVEWESPIHSILVLTGFVVACLFFEPYMAPIALLLIFLKHYVAYSWGASKLIDEDDEQQTDEDDQQDDQQDEQDDEKAKEEKKTLKERVAAVQEVTQLVQNTIGEIASFGEKIKNLVNFSVPFLSYLAIVLLLAVTTVLYYIPIRYLIMGWGINKFTRKILRPHTIPNNELLDLLSRVPDNEEKIYYKELTTIESVDGGDKSNKDSRRKQKL